jgi:RimJ/RimL family protein N-acetyltransferase
MLRMARAEDEGALLPIYTHEQVERFLMFDGVDAQRFSAIFRQLLKDGNFFVYEADGAVVGFCKATRLPGRSSHVVHLGPLAVAPEFHGRGYATAMLRAVLAEEDNVRGIALYQKLGFEREGVQRKAYKRAAERDYVDEVMMVKFAGVLA